MIVDDDPEVREVLGALVTREGFTVSCAATLAEARAQIASTAPDVLLVDLHLPDGSGLSLLDDLGPADPEIVLITGQASVETAVDALRRGASDYLTKPVDHARLKMMLANLARTLEMKGEIGALRGELRKEGRFAAMVGGSAPMQKVYDLVGRVARTDAGILITGETGTGKEVVAQTIHGLSRRRKHPFVPVDCGAISATLIETELFGHERGSFTGAERAHKGCFERAHEGTLFLDEITEMPAELQVKLLRVLETSNVVRVGAEKPIPVDVRVIAATNRSPEQAMKDGRLREDLFYRLDVFPIPLPPLRDRGDDVIRLAEHFLAELNAAEGTAKDLTNSASERIRRHTWPGNIRELRNVIQRAFIMASQRLDLAFLAESASLPPQSSSASVTTAVGTPLAAAERELILATLDHCGGDKKQAASVLQISLNTLYARLRSYKPR